MRDTADDVCAASEYGYARVLIRALGATENRIGTLCSSS